VNQPRSTVLLGGDLARPRGTAGDRPLRPLHLYRSSLGHDLAAALAGARAHVDEPVRAAHHLLVVLDDEHGVAEVAKSPSVAIRRLLSRWRSPIEGSSRM
jgi:hypothetical protein